MSYICLVQESKRESREVLGFLLSSEAFLKKDDKCIIYCNEEVKEIGRRIFRKNSNFL